MAGVRTEVRITFLFLLLTVAGPAQVSASVALLVGEPYGKFGAFNPTGHAAVYLSGVCAETPTLLRLCRPGESGTVISRYNSVAGVDWVAIPPLPYLYAVERAEDVPPKADRGAATQLRENYRRSRLRDLVPDDPREDVPKGDWVQLVGSSYDRNIYGFSFETRREEDERLIRHLNERSNRRRFNLFWRNCSDFSREILNFYRPGAVRRNIVGDFGIMTPKQAAKSLVRFSERRPELNLTHFMIPQIPGGPASTRLRGVNESLVRSKKYAIPLVVLQPWVAVSATAAYLTSGRFNPGRYSPAECASNNLTSCMIQGSQPLLVKSSPVEQATPASERAPNRGTKGSEASDLMKARQDE
jgi:hypothetical protein